MAQCRIIWSQRARIRLYSILEFYADRNTLLTAMNRGESRHSFLKGVNQITLDLHKKWLTDALHIKHVLAHRSGHFIHIDEPELVINEMKAMLK
jgi:hypothetical protein